MSKFLKALYLIATVCLFMAGTFGVTSIPALADTDGTEQHVIKPEKLVVQLGKEWAGVEFKLKTDAGMYPQPVVVDETGLLTMELGGSENYILSCLDTGIDDINLEAEEEGEPEEDEDEDKDGENENDEETSAKPLPVPYSEKNVTIPALHLILFVGGASICIIGLILMAIFKSRKSSKKNNYGGNDDDYY